MKNVFRFIALLSLVVAIAHGQTLFKDLSLQGTGNQLRSGATLTHKAGSTTTFESGAALNFGSATITWPTSGVTAGTYGSATQSLTASVDASGRITSLAAQTVTPAFSSITSKPTSLTGYGITDAQPLDSDLTAIAALTTTSYGRSTLSLADAAAGRAYFGLVIGTNVQAWSANLDSLAAQAPAYYISRANHTGTQSAATITGLASIATSGSASDLSTGTLPAARLPSDAATLTGTQTLTNKTISGATSVSQANGLSIDSLGSTRTTSQAVVYSGINCDPVYGLSALGANSCMVRIAGTPNVINSYNTLLHGLSGSPYVWFASASGGTLNIQRVGGSVVSLGTARFTVGVPFDYTIVCDGANAYLYSFGVLVGTYPFGENFSVAPNSIGATVSNTEAFNGPLRIGYWVGSSTAPEIAAAHKGQLPYWWFPGVPAGTNLITGTNSDFSGAGNWTSWAGGTISVSAGVANCTSDATVYAPGSSYRVAYLPITNPVMVNGYKYRLAGTIGAVSSGSVVFGNSDAITAITTQTAGTFTVDFTYTGATGGNLGVWATAAGATFTLDNVTLKVLGAQLFSDPDHDGRGDIWPSLQNCPGYIVKAATNRWLKQAGVRGEVRPNVYGETPVISYTLSAGTAITEGQVLASISTTGLSSIALNGLFLVLAENGGNSPGSRLYLCGGSAGFSVSGTATEIAAVRNTTFLPVKLTTTISGSDVILNLCADGSLTVASTVNVHVMHIAGYFPRALVK